MRYRVLLYAPDRGVVYDGRTAEERGVGGGITARLSLLAALADLGHDVTAYVNCAAPLEHRGVRYLPLEAFRGAEADVFIAITTGGDLSFAPLAGQPIQARLKIVWVQGVPMPAALDVVSPDYVYAASNFLRDVCVTRWQVPAAKMFVCYNGIDQQRFADVAAKPPARDPFAIAYIGPPEKGLDASVEVLRRLRRVDGRYHLDVFGGNALWGREADHASAEPGVIVKGLLGQRALAPELFRYEFCLALQAIEEGFGIAVQEARRAGAIVIASRVGAFTELVRHGQTGFLIAAAHDDAMTHDQAARLILDLGADPGRRGRLRANGFTTPWSWSLAARTWTAHWDAILGAAGDPDRARLDGGALELPDGRHSQIDGAYLPRVDPFSPLLAGESQSARVLVAGYFGHANLGDEAILHATLEELRRAVPALSVSVVSGNPNETQARHGVDAIDERDVGGIVAAADASDVIVLGGGGLFHDYHGVDAATTLSRLHWGLTFCAAFPALAAALHKPLLIHAAGVGPLTTDIGRQYTRMIFEAADVASVRDEESLQTLHALGAAPHVTITADPATLIESAPDDVVASRLRTIGLDPGRRRIGVALRRWSVGANEARWMAAIASALDRASERRDAAVLFFCFQGDDLGIEGDRQVAQAVRGQMRRRDVAYVYDANLTPPEMQGMLASCDVVLAMRLHAVMLAANALVPAVALSYDPKVSAGARRVGLHDYILDLSTATADSIAAGLERAASNRHLLREQLQPAGRELQRLARTGIDLIAVMARDRQPRRTAVSSDLSALIHATLLQQVRRVAAAGVEVERLTAALASEQEASRETREALARASEALAARNEALFDQIEGVDASFAPVIEELEAIHASRAWRMVTRYRDTRRRFGFALRHPFKTTRHMARRAAGAVIPAPQRHAIRQRWQRLLMNPYMYLFDRYKRARMATYGPHFDGVHAPGQPGFVSVVLPVYNGEALIAESVASVLSQTYPDFELIVVDDGSTDATPVIVDELARRDARLRVVHQENQKLPRALARGFAEARGEFLTWTSADNRLKPEFLSRMVDCLRRHPRWDMVYANLDLIDETGAFLKNSNYYEGYQRPHHSEHVHLPAATAELNVWPNNFVGAAFMYRSRVPYLVGDYSPHRFVLEDYDYWMRVNALATLRHVDFDQPVYDYRFHGRSLTSDWTKHDMWKRRERLMVFEEFRRDFYLAPMLWVIDGTGREANALRARVKEAGHLVYDGAFALETLPKLWVPVVFVKWSSAPQSEVVGGLPPSALKVLATTSSTLPDRVDAGWDLAVTVSDTATPLRLSKRGQGWLAAKDAGRLFHALDARAKSLQLEQIETLAEGPQPSPLKASVIVCTHRFNDRVVTVIKSVLDQTMSSADYEVIVVDNDPGKGRVAAAIDSLRRELATTSDRLRLVSCPIRGLSAARNAGLAEARGEVVSFLDDDAIAATDWLQRVVDAFAAHPKTAVIGGHIVLQIPEPRPAALGRGWEKYWSQYVTGFRGYTEVRHWWEFPWGANWSARRDALIRAGGFRLQYGRKGDNFWGGEELVAAALMQTLGGAIAVLPEATVRHDVDASRFSYDHVRRTMLAGHLASYQAQRDLYVPRESGVGTTLGLLLGRHFDSGLAGRFRARDIAYRKSAQVRLLLAQLRDVWRRRRSAVVATDVPQE